MDQLEAYGWNNFHNEYYSRLNMESLERARVISIKGFKNILITNTGEIESELSGKLLYASATESLPKVGDWVTFMRYGNEGYIIDVLPRMNELHRKNPGIKTEKQVLAANIDYALIVQGLDRDFNLMRLERYLVQITACNIQPVIVLNKADLIENKDEYRNQVESLGRNCPVYFCSAYNQSGTLELKRDLKPGKTYILIGSSGVGKSSLVNSFLDKSRCDIGILSDSSGKGKHTTTSRDLFQLDNGSLIIDTPGMREFGITFEEGQQTGGLYPAIEKLAKNCRFSDCQHLEETGCAVLDAFHNGSLESKVYESYLKLVKEQRHFEIKAEDKKRLGKQFGKMIREVKEYRKKYKY